MSTVEFEILGTPKPQGSKKAFAVNGQARMKESGGLEHAAWRNAVAAAAKDVATAIGPLAGPLRVDTIYLFKMPKSRPASFHRSGKAWKVTAPDTDKLDRALRDGLQAGGLIPDDALICDGNTAKYETTGWTGAVVRITEITEIPDLRLSA